MSDSNDPLAPSTDPDIPTPTRDDLITFVHRKHQQGIRDGTANADLIRTLLEDARRAWNERHKRQAEQRRQGEPFTGTFRDIPPQSQPEVPGEFRDIQPTQGEDPRPKGTRVVGQVASETEEERRQREQQEIEAEVVKSMHPSSRKRYDDPNTPEDQRKAIFDKYKEKLEETKQREAAEFRKKLDRIAEAQDLLQRIEADPSKADVPRPADDTEEALLTWFDDMSRPQPPPIPFPNLTPQQIRRDRMWRDIQATGRADPNDIAEEEAEALRYRLQVEKARLQKRREVVSEFLPQRPSPDVEVHKKPEGEQPVVKEAAPKPLKHGPDVHGASESRHRELFWNGTAVLIAILALIFWTALFVLAWGFYMFWVFRAPWFKDESKDQRFVFKGIIATGISVMFLVAWLYLPLPKSLSP